LREQEFGNYPDLSRMDKIDRERKEYGIFFYRIPNGESGADVYDRCTMFLDTFYRDLRHDNFPENALIVTHRVDPAAVADALVALAGGVL
jgi:broad specificity phosphatase PhoE